MNMKIATRLTALISLLLSHPTTKTRKKVGVRVTKKESKNSLISFPRTQI